VAKAIAYLRNDSEGFTTFFADGRICLSDNGAERQLRSVARGRKSLVVLRLKQAAPRGSPPSSRGWLPSVIAALTNSCRATGRLLAAHRQGAEEIAA
jgi:hypothetical protein